MSLTNAFETTVLQFAFTTGAVTRPTSWYIGLLTAAPGEAGGGTEVAGGAYVREAATFSVTGNLATNTAAIEWPTAGGAWGTLTHIAIFDAATSGTMLAYAPLTAAKTIDTGDVFRIPVGDLDITID
jgi:hypothetical protein